MELAGFLYYFPGHNTEIKPEDIAADEYLRRSLDDVLMKWQPGHTLAVVSAPNGPDNTSGVFVYPYVAGVDVRRQHGVSYNAGRQEWSKGGDWWLGYWKDDPPTESDLARPNKLPALPVELSDGTDWSAPVVRRAPGYSGLPSTYDFVDGEFVEKPVDRYQWAWELSGVAWDITNSDEPNPKVEIFKLAASFPSLNYRVSIHELGALGLLGAEACEIVICVAIAGELRNHLGIDEKSLKKTTAPSHA